MRKRSRVKLWAMLTATALTATTAACGNGSDAASGRITVTMATANQGAVLTSLEQIVASFNSSQSNVTVSLQKYPDAATLLQKTLVQLSAGQPPTLSPCQPAWATAYAKVNGLADLSTMFGTANALTTTDFSDFEPALVKSTKIGGKQVTLPFDRGLSFLYYNKSLLQQAGITTPPTTWAQFAQDAAKLTTAGSWAADFFNSPYIVSVWDAMVDSYGGSVLSADQTKAAFNSQAGRDALSFWVDLVHKNQVRVQSNPSAGQTDFGAGHTAMYVSDSTALSFIQKLVGNKFEIGAVPMPAGPAGSFTELDGANICLFDKAPQNVQQAGFQFISYLLSTSSNAAFVKASNYLPDRTSTADALKDFYAQNPIPDLAAGQMPHAVDPPADQNWPQATKDVLVQLIAAVRGDESVGDALNNAENKVNDDLKQ